MNWIRYDFTDVFTDVINCLLLLWPWKIVKIIKVTDNAQYYKYTKLYISLHFKVSQKAAALKFWPLSILLWSWALVKVCKSGLTRKAHYHKKLYIYYILQCSRKSHIKVLATPGGQSTYQPAGPRPKDVTLETNSTHTL